MQRTSDTVWCAASPKSLRLFELVVSSSFHPNLFWKKCLFGFSNFWITWGVDTRRNYMLSWSQNHHENCFGLTSSFDEELLKKTSRLCMPQVQRVKQMASEPRINPRKGVVRQSRVGKDHDSRNQGVQNVCGTGGSSNPFYSIGLFSFHFSSTLGKTGLRLWSMA